ncbi:MAG: hypothetical protein ABI183_19665 [Polyangiaceae bacterium]
MNAAAFRNQSSEDIYENLDDADERVPSQHRITVRIGRPRPADVHDLDTVRPPNAAPTEARATETRTSDVPEPSMRRLKVARPVSGAPLSIEEPLTEAMLRDPRRER